MSLGHRRAKAESRRCTPNKRPSGSFLYNLDYPLERSGKSGAEPRMNDVGSQILGRICRAQAACASSAEVREVLLQMAEKYESDSEIAAHERQRQTANDPD